MEAAEVFAMKIRRFRAYGEREDLQAVFEEFQDRLEIYYVPAYSDIGKISYNGDSVK